MTHICAQPVTAWRQKKSGKAHRKNPKCPGLFGWWAACFTVIVDDATWEQVPLSRVAPEDLCKRCWRPS